MICISVTPKSRRFAKADLLNASRQCDLIELCLDHLLKEPDISDLLGATGKPVLISCRRKADGGEWEGSEEDRLRLLRQAIVSGPAYVELELDVADKIRRYGNTRRVVSFTSLDAPIADVERIYTQARNNDADVVKFSFPTRTLDATWPLLSAVAQYREPPIVGTGLGRAGLMFSLLGRKFNSPWIYAALEKGMESYDAQPTINDLDELYGCRSINAGTRLIGVCGFGSVEEQSIRTFNAGFDALELNGRCLPLAWGELRQFGKMMSALKIRALLVGATLSEPLLEFAGKAEPAAAESRFCDLLVRQDDGWHAFNTLWRGALHRTEAALGGKEAMGTRSTLIIGANGPARAVAWGWKRRKGVVSIADPNDELARAAAEEFGLRHVPFAAIYDTLADVIVLTDPAIPFGHRKTELSPSILKPGMTAVDVSRLPGTTEFLAEASARGCRVIEPADIFRDIMQTQFEAATGHALPAAVADPRDGSHLRRAD